MVNAIDESNGAELKGREREELLNDLKQRLKEGKNIYINEPNGEGTTGSFIKYNAETKTLQKFRYERIKLTDEEENAKEQAWHEYEEIGEERDRLLDKICEADSEMGVFFQRGNQRKYDELEAVEQRAWERYQALADKEGRTINEGSVTLEEVQIYFDKIAEITLIDKNKKNEVSEWLND